MFKALLYGSQILTFLLFIFVLSSSVIYPLDDNEVRGKVSAQRDSFAVLDDNLNKQELAGLKKEINVTKASLLKNAKSTEITTYFDTLTNLFITLIDQGELSYSSVIKILQTIQLTADTIADLADPIRTPKPLLESLITRLIALGGYSSCRMDACWLSVALSPTLLKQDNPNVITKLQDYDRETLDLAEKLYNYEFINQIPKKQKYFTLHDVPRYSFEFLQIRTSFKLSYRYFQYQKVKELFKDYAVWCFSVVNNLNIN